MKKALFTESTIGFEKREKGEISFCWPPFILTLMIVATAYLGAAFFLFFLIPVSLFIALYLYRELNRTRIISKLIIYDDGFINPTGHGNLISFDKVSEVRCYPATKLLEFYDKDGGMMIEANRFADEDLYKACEVFEEAGVKVKMSKGRVLR